MTFDILAQKIVDYSKTAPYDHLHHLEVGKLLSKNSFKECFTKCQVFKKRSKDGSYIETKVWQLFDNLGRNLINNQILFKHFDESEYIFGYLYLYDDDMVAKDPFRSDYYQHLVYLRRKNIIVLTTVNDYGLFVPSEQPFL